VDGGGAADREPRAGGDVLAPNIAESDRTGEPPGPAGAGHAPDLALARDDWIAGGGNDVPPDVQPDEMAVHVPARAHALDDLLSEIAALAEADGVRERRLERDRIRPEVATVPRHPVLDAQHIERVGAGGTDAERGHALPPRERVRGRHQAEIPAG